MRIIGSLMIIILVFVFPQVTADAAREALVIFAHDIVPSLYPYMVLTKIIAERLKGLKRIPLWISIPLGIIGGTPSGYAVLSSLCAQRNICRRTLYALCTFIGTISPMFLLHTVKSWFADERQTFFLIASHFTAAAVSSVLVLYFMRKDTSIVFCNPTEKEIHGNAPVAACVYSVLNIGGCLVFFSVISAIIKAILPGKNGLLSASIHAFLEIAGGIKEISSYSSVYPRLTGILSAFCCGFSGISMISQSHLFLKQFGISMKTLVVFGMLRAFFGGVFMNGFTLLS